MPRLSFATFPLSLFCVLVGTLFAQSTQAGTLEAVNHTHWAINRFSVEGRSGIDIIGPYQGGGGGCCYSAPARWKPGMTVRVDWETGASGVSDLADEFPGGCPRFCVNGIFIKPLTDDLRTGY
ncbi:MAG: DUF3304 domain-containing protein [Pseudomonas fluorescens]|nr:DUF3304 domain-containing protein [Pseudomonas fluorescens]